MFNCFVRSVVVTLALLLFLSSCSKKDPYLYDRPGFDKGTMPNLPPSNDRGYVRVAPDYYYRQPQPVQQPSYPPQQQYYQQQGGYPAQNPGGYYQPYTNQAPPSSRFYSNPYAIPPSNNYPYYDGDQYYVPPNAYQNIETQNTGVSSH